MARDRAALQRETEAGAPTERQSSG
jgi:hypothetical protein